MLVNSDEQDPKVDTARSLDSPQVDDVLAVFHPKMGKASCYTHLIISSDHLMIIGVELIPSLSIYIVCECVASMGSRLPCSWLSCVQGYLGGGGIGHRSTTSSRTDLEGHPIERWEVVSGSAEYR